MIDDTKKRVRDVVLDSINEGVFTVDMEWRITSFNRAAERAAKEAKPILVIGTPVTRILEIAKKKKASMIILSSHGRTGLSHLLVGSKAERVVQLSPIPVLVVKGLIPN